MSSIDQKRIITSLFLNGFHLNRGQRLSPSTALLSVYKYDSLGGVVKYLILLSDGKASSSSIQLLKKRAKSERSTPFGIGDLETELVDFYTQEEFFKKLGADIETGLILNPKLPDIMKTLGFNSLPHGMSGSPDDLLEHYVKECLQYLFDAPTRRYGKDRSFESLPDGAVLSDRPFVALFDSKAYGDGFKFQSDDINRFAKYVDEFNTRYAHLTTSVKAFIVVSGKFLDSNQSIQDRSNDLLSKCRTPLCCIESQELATMVKSVLSNPDCRKSIDWNRLLMNSKLKLQQVDKDILKISKDKIN